MWQSLRTRTRRWFGGLALRRPVPPQEILVVRRGLSASYYDFLRIFARANRIAIIFDRRMHERRHPDSLRSSGERRLADRRGPVPASWDGGDVVVFAGRTPAA